MNTKLIFILALSAGVPACSTFYAKRDAVVLTAIAADVEKCKRLGFVNTYSPESDKEDGRNQLRAETLRLGGNTVKVTSYIAASNGTAYACDPPIDPNSRSVDAPRG